MGSLYRKLNYADLVVAIKDYCKKHYPDEVILNTSKLLPIKILGDNEGRVEAHIEIEIKQGDSNG